MWWWWVVQSGQNRIDRTLESLPLSLELLGRGFLGSRNGRAELVHLRDHAGHAFLKPGDGSVRGLPCRDAICNGLVDPQRHLPQTEHEIGNQLGARVVRVWERCWLKGGVLLLLLWLLLWLRLRGGVLSGKTGWLALGWVV